jgi:hypothetical protein
MLAAREGLAANPAAAARERERDVHEVFSMCM